MEKRWWWWCISGEMVLGCFFSFLYKIYIYTHPYTYTVKQTSAEYNKIQNSLVCYFCCCCFLGAASCSCFLEYCYNSMHHTNTITNKFTHSHPFLGKYTHEWRQQRRRRRWQTKTKRGRKFVKIFLGFSRPKITY